MKYRKKSGMLTAVILWAVILNVGMQLSFGPNAMAADVVGANLTGETFVSTQTCSATVGGSFARSLNVTAGDNVLIYYDINWTDTRPSNSVIAHHEFWFDVRYGVFVEQDGTMFNTTGDEFGSDQFLITVPLVSESGNIYLNWTDAIDVNNGTCVDTDGRLGYIRLY